MKGSCGCMVQGVPGALGKPHNKLLAPSASHNNSLETIRFASKNLLRFLPGTYALLLCICSSPSAPNHYARQVLYEGKDDPSAAHCASASATTPTEGVHSEALGTKKRKVHQKTFQRAVEVGSKK